MYPVLFTVHEIPIYSYGIGMLLAFTISTGLVIKYRSKSGISFYHIVDFCLIAIFSIFFAEKIFIFIVSFPHQPFSLIHILKFWERGAHATFGAFLPAAILVAAYCRLKKLPLALTIDFLFPYTMLALAIQRFFGCFLAGCCFGKPTSLPWGIIFPAISRAGARFSATSIHPTQLYYGLSSLFIFGLLIFYQRRQRTAGESTAIGVFGFSLTYFLITFLRGDLVQHSTRWNLTHSQYASLILLGVSTFFMLRRFKLSTPKNQTSTKMG